MPADLPFLDEHAIGVAAPREAVWAALQDYVAGSLVAPRDLRLRRLLLGTHPPGGFAIAAAVPPQHLELTGRHRFSRYRLVFALGEGDGTGTTRLSARSFAVFPGLHGAAYRTLVIGTRFHVLATRGMLGAVRTRALAATARP
jgi:hypothetical protein